VRVVAQHRSCYRYPRPALLGPQLIRLQPADHVRARVERYQLQIAPEHRLYWPRDPHGNGVARVTLGPSGRRCSTCVCGTSSATLLLPTQWSVCCIDRLNSPPNKLTCNINGGFAY
jgi:hypothetical protein